MSEVQDINVKKLDRDMSGYSVKINDIHVWDFAIVEKRTFARQASQGNVDSNEP